MFRPLLIMEGIASTSLEHPSDCRCDICRAADGDLDAMARVFMQVLDEIDPQEE